MQLSGTRPFRDSIYYEGVLSGDVQTHSRGCEGDSEAMPFPERVAEVGPDNPFR